MVPGTTNSHRRGDLPDYVTDARQAPRLLALTAAAAAAAAPSVPVASRIGAPLRARDTIGLGVSRADPGSIGPASARRKACLPCCCAECRRHAISLCSCRTLWLWLCFRRVFALHRVVQRTLTARMEVYAAGAKFDCLLFDMDDILYPLSLVINLACCKNRQGYMLNKLRIEESQVPKMCLDLYREYGTTMAGLKFQNLERTTQLPPLLGLLISRN